MERINSRDKKALIIKLSLTLTIILLMIINIVFIKYRQNLRKTIDKISIKHQKYVSNNNNTNNELNDIKENIINLKNIDNNIKDTKEELFNNIKQLEDKILEGSSKGKIAYITFDDGPYYSTYDFLKVLKEYNVKATFFTIGLGKESCYDNKSKNCYDLFEAIAKDGHTIANHTYSHLIFSGLYNSTDSFINSVKKQEELIYSKTGITTNIIRFPGGSSSAGKLKNSIIAQLKEMNYGWVDWTAQDGDGGSLTNKNTALNNFKNSINDNIEVILFHDYSNITLSILPDAIEYLKTEGYILLPLFYDSNMINK